MNEGIGYFLMMVKNENLIRRLIQIKNYSFYISIVVFRKYCAQAAIMNGRNMM